MRRAAALACLALATTASAQELAPLPEPWVRHELPEGFGQLRALACADDVVFARSWQGRVARFDGERWQAVPARLHAGMNLWAARDGSSLFTTTEGSIARFADGAWTLVEAPLGPTYSEQILSFDGEHAIAVGRARIVAWNGDAYAAFDAGTWRDLHAIAGAAEDDLWVGGDRGHVFHFDGHALSARRIESEGHVIHLWASRDRAWAVLERPSGVFEWTEGAWHDRTGRLRDASITAIGGDGDAMWAVGDFGVVRWDARHAQWIDVLWGEHEIWGMPRFWSVCTTRDSVVIGEERATWVRPRSGA